MSDQASLVTGIAGRYATAIFEIADEADQLDDVGRDLGALEGALNESEDLRDLIRSPIYARGQQAAGIGAVAEAMDIGQTTRNLLGLMASKRRLFALPELIKGYRALLADKRGEISADVVSARPLSEAQAARLAEVLKKSVGKDVALNATVDENLIGGLVVKVGSRMIDTSIRAKLAGMQNAMKEVG